MLAVERYVPRTKQEAERFVGLHTALTRLGVVRTLLKGDGWRRFSYDENNMRYVVASIGHRVTLGVDTDPVNSGLFIVRHKLNNNRFHEIDASSEGYQSVQIQQDSESITHVSEPTALVEEGRAYELSHFTNGANLAFEFVTRNLK
jgi:hypothetical protein